MRKTIAVVAAAVLAVGLAGCGTPPWEGSPGATPDVSESESAAPTAVPAPVPNDLSTGSTQRTLTAGAVTADVNYWSDLRMDKWTPSALKPVQLSMTTTVKPNDGQKVYLEKATMVAVPGNAAGELTPLPDQIDQATTTPGYLVLKPYSYSQVFNVGPVPVEATYVTLRFTYNYLVQTTPKSKEYSQQTATDTLTVAIAPE